MHVPKVKPTAAAAALVALAGLPALVSAAIPSTPPDPCTKVAGKTFVVPKDALACLKSFPFDETLRENVLTNIARVLDFYTFEDYYLNSPRPFQESTTDIRGEIDRINGTFYETDYAFNKDVYDLTTQLNDGHTRWFPNCYLTFPNLLPAPLVTLEENGKQGVFVAPDSVEFISQLGPSFTGYFDSINFDWKRLAGARVLKINGVRAYEYVDFIASTESGNYLDHGVRVNSVFSSYIISGNDYDQRFGDIAATAFPNRRFLRLKLILVGATAAEWVKVPYLSVYVGAPFTDKTTFWAANCAANAATNGFAVKTAGEEDAVSELNQPRAVIIDNVHSTAALPAPFRPTLPPVSGSTGVIKAYVLPDKKTGVMFVGSFAGNFNQFQFDAQAAIQALQAAGVTRLLIDLTNNGGGFVCLGQFLHQYLAGADFGYPGFQSTSRANPLAQKIVKADIAQGTGGRFAFYSPNNWAHLDGTRQAANFDYNDPSVSITVNGVTDQNSQRFLDICTPFAVQVPKTPAFDLKNVAIVSNGNCASTCAMFSTVMFERHQTKIAVFGGKPHERMEYKGMAGNQVLEWVNLDNEIKIAGVKNDPLAPPDLLVRGNMRHNWRTAWSWLDESIPIQYKSERPQLRFPYTKDTYNNPQNLWTFAAGQLFGP